MIKDIVRIKDWKLIILYDCTRKDINTVIQNLERIDCPQVLIDKAIDNLGTSSLNAGLSYSNLDLKSSVIVVSRTSSVGEFINTISHEYYHLMCHLRSAYPYAEEEEFATLTGNLNMQSYKIIEELFFKVDSF